MFQLLRRLLQDVRRAQAARQRRADAYRDLASLDAQMLRDLGLSHRAAAESPRPNRYEGRR